MATIFQLHADLTRLKATVREMALLWHEGDSVLLLGETAVYLSWFNEYIEAFNTDEEFDHPIRNIKTLYVLKDDIAQLNDTALQSINLTIVKQISDEEWVLLLSSIDRVVTLDTII